MTLSFYVAVSVVPGLCACEQGEQELAAISR